MEEEEYQQLKGELEKKEKGWSQQFRLKNGMIYWKDKRVIPRREVSRIISIFHDNGGHLNKDAVLEHIRKRYVWKTMYKDVKDYIQSCWECQQRGNPRQNNRIQSIPVEDIFERWGIDIVGPLPLSYKKNKYIIVAVDYFTRWPEARALKYANAESVAEFIYEEIICRFGPPSVIQSDQGTHFVNQVIKELTEKFRIKHSLSSPYHPQSNGLVERFNRSLC